MYRAAILACLPWIGVLIAAVLVARLLLWLSGAELRLSRLRTFHDCQEGSVQSLSFVLTIPVFVMIMMLIVQVSQIMIGTVLVHYAAYASARSAIVWIPANLANVNGGETENRISSIRLIEGDPMQGESRYEIEPNLNSPKYRKVRQAAVLACLPLAPSRDLGYPLSAEDQETALALAKAHQGLDQQSLTNSRIPQRLASKLAYSLANTEVELTFRHNFGGVRPEYEPPLQINYEWPNVLGEFQDNELGWQDHITAKVTHHMALLPGPGRLLARSTGSGDQISRGVDRRGQVYVWALTASASLGNEGDKPVRRYLQEEVP